jgi:hypothetical protein
VIVTGSWKKYMISTFIIYGRNQPTPWSRGLLEKIRVSQLVKKFPAFYGTRRFITAFKRASDLSLS